MDISLHLSTITDDGMTTGEVWPITQEGADKLRVVLGPPAREMLFRFADRDGALQHLWNAVEPVVVDR